MYFFYSKGYIGQLIKLIKKIGKKLKLELINAVYLLKLESKIIIWKLG